MSAPKRVLFLCTGNSCRSQLAEAIVNYRLEGTWQAFSAGTKPAGYVHPLALQALGEMGIQHNGRSKSVEELRGMDFDLVVTVCELGCRRMPGMVRTRCTRAPQFSRPGTSHGHSRRSAGGIPPGAGCDCGTGAGAVGGILIRQRTADGGRRSGRHKPASRLSQINASASFMLISPGRPYNFSLRIIGKYNLNMSTTRCSVLSLLAAKEMSPA